MAEISVIEYAQLYGTSEQLVRKAAREGVLPARKSGGTWLIDDSARLSTERRRPLADRAADALLSLVDGNPSVMLHLAPTERSRVAKRLADLRADESPATLLSAWLRPRLSRPLRLAVQRADLPDLRNDERLVAGGVSDPRSEISAPDMFEAHVAERDVDGVRRDFLLRESAAPNVILHLAAEPPRAPLPLSALLLDLAQDGGPREQSQVRRLIREVSA